MTDSVIRGQADTREARYHLDGVLSDPASPQVTLRDAVGVAYVTAAPTRIGTGIYRFDWVVPLGGALGNWQAEWTGVLAGQSVGPIIEVFTVLPIGAIAPITNSSYTYDLGTNVGKLRLLIQDHDLSSVSTSLPLEQRSAAFADEELQAILDLNTDDLLTAAAMALRTWANSKQLIVIARKTGRTEVDYGTIRADLLAAAKEFERTSRETPADGIAEQTWTDFTLRQILNNEYLRQMGG